MTAPAAFAVVNNAGKDFHCYSNSGTHGSPVWAEQGNIKDLTVGDAIATYKASLRAGGGYDGYVGTQRDLNPKFKVAYIPTDPLVIALIAAANGGTAIDLVFLDDLIATDGAFGPRGDWLVEGVPRSENLAEGSELDISLKPALTANYLAGTSPSYMTVSS